jgi:hypothetical protein
MQFFGLEKFTDLTRTSATTAQLPAGSNIRVGGQAYKFPLLTLDTATDIDTGSLVGNSLYYVYAVVVAGAVNLKYSLSPVSPLGFLAYRKVALFFTNLSSEVGLVVPRNNYPFSKALDISLDGSGDITTGNVYASRSLNEITLKFSLVTHGSNFGADSAAGILPEWLRPTDEDTVVSNNYFGNSSFNESVYAKADGGVAFRYNSSLTINNNPASISYRAAQRLPEKNPFND